MIKNLLITTLFLTSFSYADTINCKVVGVSDGDTITCLTKKKEQIKVRLYQIDAPEKKQAFGQRSKQALSDLVFSKDVTITTHGKDKYKRTLGTIWLTEVGACQFVYDINVNLRMIKQGMSWYWPFAKKNQDYKQAEQQAKKREIGLWADKNPIAPWKFRKRK